jgi:hypothetical protein
MRPNKESSWTVCLRFNCRTAIVYDNICTIVYQNELKDES